MKKILIIITLIIPLIAINNLQAQSNPSLPNFDAYVHVDAPAQCPSSGSVNGYIPLLGNSYTQYQGTTGGGGQQPYHLLWNGSFPGPQPVTVKVTTDTNEQGIYCYDEKTETLTGYDYGHHFYLQLVTVASSGGGGDDDQ